MKKLKKIELKIDKEVISNLNQNNLDGIKGGTEGTTSKTCAPTNLSNCCTFASNCLCATKNMGNCTSIGYGVGEKTQCIQYQTDYGNPIPQATSVCIQTLDCGGIGVGVATEGANCNLGGWQRVTENC